MSYRVLGRAQIPGRFRFLLFSLRLLGLSVLRCRSEMHDEAARGGFEAQVDRSKALLWLAAWQIMASSSLLGLVNLVPACNFCSGQLSSMRHFVAS